MGFQKTGLFRHLWPVEDPTTIQVLRRSDPRPSATIPQNGPWRPPALPAVVPPALWHLLTEPAAPTFHSPQAVSLFGVRQQG
ncbi:hypothetical protein MDA_GLEAN10003863 [Myotis davidii]|uniref:Uncharacterized protein n=1 Tax=Myotis davidii TaxID=225400 RepID=L5LW51_MYODS|nr:hypothetical protein MDA_GLEAN10003863 [Myotis davidii]